MKKKKKKKKPKQKKGYAAVVVDDLDDSDDDDDENATLAAPRAPPPPPPPSLLTVLRANVIIFLYTLPINLFSIVLLYGVTTCASALPCRVPPLSIRPVSRAPPPLLPFAPPLRTAPLTCLCPPRPPRPRLVLTPRSMALSEALNTQWDDLIALTLALFLVPGHMCWCLGNPSRNVSSP